MFFRHSFLHRFFNQLFGGNGTKISPRLNGAASLFAPEIDHTCTFYLRNTYKCQKQFFQLFFQKLKEFIHTCIFYLRNTYKCAMTVFTILKKKINEKNLMIFLIFGSLLAPFGSLLAPIGSLLAPFECQTSSKILFFVRFGFTFC